MWEAARFAGRDQNSIEICHVELAAGSVAIHSGETWHGSGVNCAENEERISIGLHFIPESARFRKEGRGYIFRRYQIAGEDILRDCFFPTV
jgi:ectoine hydroxylase-related dioxygenase (phytanoyl-CoA dioxygenase family)